MTICTIRTTDKEIIFCDSNVTYRCLGLETASSCLLGYVYNPKEARLRKALREQTRGSRSGGATSRWTKHPLTMSVNLNLNHHRQSLVSPVLLPQQPCCADNTKAMLHEQVDRDGTMLQSYPDYLDLPYNMPSADTQAWYPSYMQPGAQTNGGYVDRASENKLPVDWSTPYNSEHGNFIRASPQSSPYSLQNQVEVNSLMLNGERAHPHTDQTGGAGTPCTVDLKPVVDQILPATADSATIKDPEQQVKELLASAKVICEGSPLLNGKQEESGSTRLPGFHQAFGSTEIGRFSQPDGFFEAAVAAENERKVNMSPLPPPPPKRGRGPRGGRKGKSRIDQDKWPDPCLPMGNQMVKDSWQDWNPGLQPGCDNPLSSMQRMNCYPYDEQRPGLNCPPHPDMYQWHPDTPYYERQNCGQYYPPYYNTPHPQANYHDCYPPYDYPPPPPSWRSHPYYHPSHFPHPHSQNTGYYHGHGHGQQYSEYRHYGYQSGHGHGRWAGGRSGMV